MNIIKKLSELIKENKEFEDILKETINKIIIKESENKFIKKFLIKR